MTTDLSTLSNAELLLRIVSAKRDCPYCLQLQDLEGGPYSVSGCEVCGGTGKVPILDPKLMRLPCDSKKHSPCYKEFGYDTPSGGNYYETIVTTDCQGRNWVPNPDAWDMKKALHQAGFHLGEVHRWPSFQQTGDDWSAVCYPYNSPKLGNEGTWDADPKRARYLTVAGAFGI